MSQRKSPRRSRATLTTTLAAVLALPATAQEPRLDEVVVTAQKRSENLQQVGIAIDAFSGEDLDEMGFHTLADVTKISSNVELFDEYGSGQPTWVIRGVGLADFNANNTPTAAIYVDDIYMTSNVMGGMALFDLERIEVLKGPQGALYGRNTSGGAVRVLSRRPDMTQAGGYVTANYGRWDDASLEAATNMPLSDTMAVRVAGRWNQSYDGWQENVLTGEEHGEKDRWALRASLLTTFGGQGEALLRIHGGKDESEITLGQTIGLYNPAGPGFCAPILAGRIDNSACAAYSTFYDQVMPNAQSNDGSKTLADPINKLDNSSVGGSLELSWEFPTARLTSITGLEDFEYHLLFDYDGGHGEYSHQDASTDIKVFSQEFRLASTSEGALDWQLGLEYGTDDLDEDRKFQFKDDFFTLVPMFGGQAGVLAYDQETESWAAWAQLGYQLTETIRLNAGVRYTDEEKKYKNGSVGVISAGTYYPWFTGIEDSLDLDIFSGKISLDWNVTDSAMMYLSVSRGFKSGGFFGGFPSNGPSSIVPYDEETVIAYEVGLKSQWLENTLRFNVALFHYDYQDAQGFYSVLDPNGLLLTRLGNVGDAEHDGMEVELLWAPTERFSLQANGAWLDARITDSDLMIASWMGTFTPLEGHKRRMAPDYSYSLIGRYTMPLGESLESTLQLDYNWRDDLGGDGASVIESTMLSEQDAYGLLGARLSLSPVGGSWEVALWGHNLADEEYVVNVTNDNVASWMRIPGQPRSYGIEASYHW